MQGLAVEDLRPPFMVVEVDGLRLREASAGVMLRGLVGMRGIDEQQTDGGDDRRSYVVEGHGFSFMNEIGKAVSQGLKPSSGRPFTARLKLNPCPSSRASFPSGKSPHQP